MIETANSGKSRARGDTTAFARMDELLDGIETLPPSPYPLPELFKALMDPDGDLNRVVEMITFDPALTAKLLQLCNSAFFSRGTRANDVAEAVNRLGLQTVYQVVASIKGPRIFEPDDETFGHDGKDLWKHAVMSALMAQFMAEDLKEHGGLFFTAGLLHDLGKMLMGKAFREKYSLLVDEARQERQLLYIAEHARFGVNHAALGARLLDRWRFSTELVSSVRFHHTPDAEDGWKRGAAIVQGASAFSHAAHPDENQAALMWEAEAGLKILGWKMEDLGRYWARLEENMAMVKMLLRTGP